MQGARGRSDEEQEVSCSAGWCSRVQCHVSEVQLAAAGAAVEGSCGINPCLAGCSSLTQPLFIPPLPTTTPTPTHPQRHLNVRGKSASLPSITDKDWEDIKFGVDNNLDFYALSFVKDAKVIRELKEYLAKNNASHIK